MNIVAIKHFESSGNYIFSVPEDRELKEGDIVLVETRYGIKTGMCICDSFWVSESPLKILMKQFGANKPLMPVIGKYNIEKWEEKNEN